MEPLHRDKNSTKSTELSGPMKLYLNTGEILYILYCKVSFEVKALRVNTNEQEHNNIHPIFFEIHRTYVWIFLCCVNLQ